MCKLFSAFLVCQIRISLCDVFLNVVPDAVLVDYVQ